MKKVLSMLGTLVLGLSISSTTFAAELHGADIKKDIPSSYTEAIDFVDGKNDPTTVNRRITKISNTPLKLKSDLITPLGAGEWDYLGYSKFRSTSGIFYSGGGDFMMYITQPYVGPAFTWNYKLMEDDPVLDDTIDIFNLPNEAGTWMIQWSVGSYVDSDDKASKAELYLHKMTMPFEYVTVEGYD